MPSRKSDFITAQLIEANLKLIFTGIIGIITAMITGLLVLNGHDVPVIITVMDSAVLGFFFGTSGSSATIVTNARKATITDEGTPHVE